MKRTYPIKRGEYWNLLRKLITHFGYPRYYQELVIYIESPDNFKITLARDGLRWSWAEGEIKDKYAKTNHRVKTGLGGIKEKLLFLANKYGSRGHISIVQVLAFVDTGSKVRVEMRPNSMIGEIVSVIAPKGLLANADKRESFLRFLKQEVKPHLEGDLLEKTSGLKNKNEQFIHFRTSDSPILDTRILDFCRQNGIMDPFRMDSTYRELLTSKSNNYSIYEDVFLSLTSVRLLCVDKHCNLPDNPEKTVSIIIPCYDSEATISKTLRSIKHQKIHKAYLKQTEVILVDDNSRVEISKGINTAEYPFQIKVIRLSRNHGVSHARQLGVTHSRGDILIFIDSDVVLSDHYLSDHVARNTIIDNAVFVSFKENVSASDNRISEDSVERGVEMPNYSKDLRIKKKVDKAAVGSYKVTEPLEVRILEETNYFKDFHGSRTFGVYDLSCMVTGHNFSLKRELALRSSPFSQLFKGWGMEDVYFGLKMISTGNYIIPVLSSGVFHIDHQPRSGNREKKQREYQRNTEIINRLLDSVVE